MSKKVMKLASRGKRFGAHIIDSIVPCILGMLCFVLMCLLAYDETETSGFGYSYGYGYGYGNPSGASSAGYVLVMLIVCVLSLAYLGVQLFFYARSQSIGKAILGMQVIDAANGEPVGIWRMVLRELFAKRASAAAFCLGYIWVIVDEKNRSWHDKIVDSYVIDLRESAILTARNATEAVKNNASAVAQAEIPEYNPEPVVEQIVEDVVEMQDEPAEGSEDKATEIVVDTDVVSE